MNRSELLTMMCSRADGSVDEARLAALRNRWSRQARAASLAVRFARYGSGFSPSARAASAEAAKARGGIPGDAGKVMAPGGRGGFIEAGGNAPGSESRVNTPPSKVMAPGGRGGFIEAGGQAPGSESRVNTPPGKVMAPGGRGGFIAAGGQAPGGNQIRLNGVMYDAMPDGRLVPSLRRVPGDNAGFEPGAVSGAGSGASMRGIRAPGPSSSVPGPGAGALEGKQYRINGKLYYVKGGVLTKAWADGGTRAKQGGRGGKFLPMPTEGKETARNLEILRKAGVVLPDGSGGSEEDKRRRY